MTYGYLHIYMRRPAVAAETQTISWPPRHQPQRFPFYPPWRFTPL